MTEQSIQLWTSGSLAQKFGVTRDQMVRVLQNAPCQPIAWAGNCRAWGADVLPHVERRLEAMRNRRQRRDEYRRRETAPAARITR